MARVPDTLFTDFTDGGTIHASDYTREREIMRVAINDFDDKVNSVVPVNAQEAIAKVPVLEAETVNARGGYATLDARLDGADVKLAESASLIDSQSISVKDTRFGAKGNANYYNSANWYQDSAFTILANDDTSAINSALTYAQANNLKEVYLPQGNYLVNGEGTPTYSATNGGIIINFPVTLRLHKNAVIQQKTSSQNGYTIVNLKNASNVTVTGGSIIGDASTHNGTTGESGNGIYLRNSSNITIDGVNISKCWGDGVGFDFNTTNGAIKNTNITVKNCVLDSNRRQGITITSAQNTFIINNIFQNAGAINGTLPKSGIDIEGSPGVTSNNNIVIQGNYFTNNIGADIILSDTMDGTKIIDNTFKTSSYGINFASNQVTMQNITVENNSFDGTNATSTGFGIYLNMYNGIGIIISKNVVKNFIGNSSSAGIDYYGTGDKVSISGNNIKNCYSGIIMHTSSPNTLIDGNIIYDTTSHGIWYYGNNSNTIVSNNILKNIGGQGIQFRAANGVVIGNLIQQVGGAGIILIGAQNCIISSNTLIDFAQTTTSDGGINSWNATSYNNLIHSNMLKTSNSAVAITIGYTPSGSHNYVRSNVVNYMANSIVADANCVVDNNYTT